MKGQRSVRQYANVKNTMQPRRCASCCCYGSLRQRYRLGVLLVTRKCPTKRALTVKSRVSRCDASAAVALHSERLEVVLTIVTELSRIARELNNGSWSPAAACWKRKQKPDEADPESDQ